MVKADMSRDYYADLELPPTADIADIKKQYRKLALKWHPDRNVGHEDEVRPRFVVIQEAMEVLSDPVQKQKFDANRRRTSRHPTSSGVKGNPWQDVSSRFPQPPKRSTAPPTRQHNPSTGASRYANWAPPPSRSAKENASEHARAWDRMRPSSSGGKAPQGSSGSRQQSPRRTARNAEPQSVPRTAGQKQRAEASFGSTARRTGFVPASPMGDEPAVSNSHYFTTNPRTNIFDVASAAAAAAAAAKKNAATSEKPKRPEPDDPLSHQFGDGFLDERQSTPYANHVGEKTNPFDGLNLSRARTVRDAFRRAQQNHAPGSPTPSRPRSVSVGDSSPTPKPEGTFDTGLHRDSANGRESAPRHSAFDSPHSSSSTVNSTKANSGAPPTSQASNGPSVYAFPPQTPSFSYDAQKNWDGLNTTPSGSTIREDVAFEGTRMLSPEEISLLFARPIVAPRPIPSGEQDGECERPQAPEESQVPVETGANKRSGSSQGRRGCQALNEDCLSGHVSLPKQPQPPQSLNTFKKEIHDTLERLIAGRGKWPQARPEKDSSWSLNKNCDYPKASAHANHARAASFTFNIQDDTFDETLQGKSHRFTRDSAENINTKFSDGDDGVSYQFNASGPSGEREYIPTKRRHREGTTRGRQSPMKNDPMSGQNFTNPGASATQDSEAALGGFDADEWSEKFGPEHFVPPQPSRASSSPTRRGTKKSKPVKMTAGTAGMFDEGDTSSEERTRAGAAISGNVAPTPMDIDTPPPDREGSSIKNARNIQVEPSRKEWRAGDVDGSKPATPARIPTDDKTPPISVANAVGSEDSEDFLRSSVFANTEPFAKTSSGLGSLGDLKSTLPFQSKPSAKLPIRKEKAKPLEFPHAPPAPRRPAVLAISGLVPSPTEWARYVSEFNVYMIHWTEFNGRVTDHFAARRRQIDETRKNGSFEWVDSRGDSGIEEYLQWLEEDRIVRQKWTAACDTHELTVREFQKHRQQMKQ